jgi:agmatine deiminase
MRLRSDHRNAGSGRRLPTIPVIVAIGLGLASPQTTSAQGAAATRTFPPEYAPQAAMWLGWSEEEGHHPVQVQMIRALLPHVAIRLMVRSELDKENAIRILSAAGVMNQRIAFIKHPLATNWIRDSGPRFLSDGQSLGVADFAWNGYGYPAEIRATFGKGALGRGAIDNDIAKRMNIPVVSTSIVAEGGALDVSRTVMIAYRQTAMERNPGIPFDQIEREYLRLYGKKKIIWLTRAPLSDRVFSGPKIANYFGWGANGHIDEFVRFVNDTTIAIAHIEDADAATNPLSAADKAILDENLVELRSSVNVDGQPFHIVQFPVPSLQDYVRTRPLSVDDKKRDSMGAWYRAFNVGDAINWVPAVSYLNFVISNGVVLAPAYWHEGLPQTERQKDETVRNVLHQLFPDREIVQINPLPINWSGGGMHCSTQQEPALRAERDGSLNNPISNHSRH